MSKNDLDKPHCHCAVFGVFGSPAAAQLTYFGLIAQQHRGQEGSGIVTADSEGTPGKTRFHVHKDFGLVDDVYRQDRVLVDVLKGSSAIGHNRYSTAGASNNKANIQPFTVMYKGGNIAIAHNGNLTNFREIRNRLQDVGTIFQTTSDTEVILQIHPNVIRKLDRGAQTPQGWDVGAADALEAFGADLSEMRVGKRSLTRSSRLPLPRWQIRQSSF